MKKMTMHDMAERYKLMDCVGGNYKCPKCEKEFEFKLTNFYGFHFTKGLIYKCPHCNKSFTLGIIVEE